MPSENNEAVVLIILGGMLSIAGGAVASWLPLFLSNRRQRSTLAASLAAEISAIVAICERHKYIEHCNQLLQHMKKNPHVNGVRMHLRQDYTSIFAANLALLGLLPAERAADVVKFYTQIKSLIENAHPEAAVPPTPEAAIHHLENQIALLEETMSLGRSVSKALLAIAE